MPINERPSDEFISLLRKSGDGDVNVAQAAQREFAKALELPLRKGVLVGNILGNIFEAHSTQALVQALVSKKGWKFRQVFYDLLKRGEILLVAHQSEQFFDHRNFDFLVIDGFAKFFHGAIQVFSGNNHIKFSF